jgi:hypothetical protein
MDPAKLYDATEAVLAARKAAQDADLAKKAAEAEFVALMEDANLPYVETSDGVRIAVEVRPSKKYDAALASDLLAVETFDRVVKAVIDAKAWNAACEVGLIEDQIAEKVTTVTYSTQVRVYGDGVAGSRS